ncbi:hypothetical protein LOK49_LG05G00899 [Camellia lanceoleosa]|uniref:Uncharacterized protein n=1 Tax=Camellia lanceoleosa TaxID=1840588 RepID=A0ACC0HHH7_9ERIC|nr:hypothetical protein LOK49_LG05G00899 [Camellia lanceoleosa]
MMSRKHLHEILKEDQEPFLLKDYIADRRSQLIKRPMKRKPIVESSISKRGTSLCKQSCFFSFHDSPVKKSPCKSPNTVRLHVPPRTSALLLEAAMRIHKHSSKPKTQIRNVGFGLFASILKRLSGMNKSRNREIAKKSAGKSEKLQENVEKSVFEMGLVCSCSSNSRRERALWSESNEEKSLDLETCSSFRSEDLGHIESVAQPIENGDFSFCEKHFCSSPLSPFRFSLQKSPSSGHRTPNFSSPATSPIHPNNQEENCEVKSIQEIEEEEEREQCSPVSVLDPPFEDDEDDGHEYEDEDEDSYDVECSYAIVQRAQRQLLHKLRRFEKLAELDPIELEKRLLEEQEDEDLEEEEECEDGDLLLLCSEKDVDWFVREVLCKSGLNLSKVSADMKMLVLDLIAEEKRGESEIEDGEVVVKRVCERLDSWKEVEPNTIDMMVELDFRREIDGWKRNDQEQLRGTAMEIEIAIFGLLVEELSEELLCL